MFLLNKSITQLLQTRKQKVKTDFYGKGLGTFTVLKKETQATMMMSEEGKEGDVFLLIAPYPRNSG